MSPPAEFNGIVLDFPHYILRCGFQICECFSAFLTLSIYIEKELEERYLHFSYWVIIYKHQCIVSPVVWPCAVGHELDLLIQISLRIRGIFQVFNFSLQIDKKLGILLDHCHSHGFFIVSFFLMGALQFNFSLFCMFLDVRTLVAAGIQMQQFLGQFSFVSHLQTPLQMIHFFITMHLKCVPYNQRNTLEMLINYQVSFW